MIGIDPIRGSPRFTFGRMELMDGIGFVPVIMGLFGLAEILENAEKPFAQMVLARMSSLIPTRQGYPGFRRTHPAGQLHRHRCSASFRG